MNIEREIRELKRRCCCNNGLPETEGQPIGEPTNNQNIQYDPTTGELWGWDGADWVILNVGGTDTNFFNANLTQDNNRTHDASGFSVTINDILNLLLSASNQHRLYATDGTAHGELIINKTRSHIHSDSGGDAVACEVAAITAVGVVLRDESGRFWFDIAGGIVPPAGSNVGAYLKVDSVTGRWYLDDVSYTLLPSGTGSVLGISGFYVNVDSGPITWRVADQSAAILGTVYHIKNRGDDVLTIATDNDESIIYATSADTSLDIPAGSAAILHFDGVMWNVQ